MYVCMYDDADDDDDDDDDAVVVVVVAAPAAAAAVALAASQAQQSVRAANTASAVAGLHCWATLSPTLPLTSGPRVSLRPPHKQSLLPLQPQRAAPVPVPAVPAAPVAQQQLMQLTVPSSKQLPAPAAPVSIDFRRLCIGSSCVDPATQQVELLKMNTMARMLFITEQSGSYGPGREGTRKKKAPAQRKT